MNPVQFEKGKELAKGLVTAVNTMGSGEAMVKGFLEELDQSHRTLQQSAIRVMWDVLLGYRPGGTDLRNEDAAALSAKLRQLAAADTVPQYLRFV